MRPSWMPYRLPSEHTPEEKQSPGGVGVTSERMASAMDTCGYQCVPSSGHSRVRRPRSHLIFTGEHSKYLSITGE